MLSETVRLGNVSLHVGVKLPWDAKNLTATNRPEAERYLKRRYRQGWAP